MSKNQCRHLLTWNATKAPALTAKYTECEDVFKTVGKPGDFTRWIVQICEAALTASATPNTTTGKIEIDAEVFNNLKGWQSR
jgi:hypothetical protein